MGVTVVKTVAERDHHARIVTRDHSREPAERSYRVIGRQQDAAGGEARAFFQVQIGDEQGSQSVSLSARDFGYIVRMSASFVVTRFAPSPSGELHLGNARTALFNYLLALRAGGRFLLRIEDTDAERSQERYVEALRADLAWLGLGWDGEPVRQSERASIYARYFEQLERAQLEGQPGTQGT